MIIECASCPVNHLHQDVRDARCGDCMVTALLSPGIGLPLDHGERTVVERFVTAGLIGSDRASALRARSEPGSGVRAVG